MSIESCSLYSQIYYSNFFLFFIIRYTHWVQHKLTPSEQCHRAHIAWSQSWHATVWPPESNRTHTPSHAFSWVEKKKKRKARAAWNAEPSPPLQNSWEQQTLSSETLGKGFRSTKKSCSLHLLCKWLRDILISCWLWLPPPLRTQEPSVSTHLTTLNTD